MFYDAYGNILSKNGAVYQYGDSRWKDKLSAYNGQYISYDSQGNPIRYLGHELRWEKGRQLKSFDGNTYTYNANGIRTSKTIDGVTHTYILDGVNILRETWDGNTLTPLYDNEEAVCGIIYNDTPYYFRKNLQGDIIAITDKNGDLLARYTYDAWGKCTITDRTTLNPVIDINPYRYRSYYYDPEIQMYYLQSRYYDPEVGRFINADEAVFCVAVNKTSGHHLFAYCENSPPNVSDPSGYFSISATLAAILAAILEVAKQVVYYALIIVLAVFIVYTISKLAKEVSKQIKASKKKTEIPSKLKSGDKVKTPTSHENEFNKNKGGSYTHKKTGWVFEKSKDGHYNGEHWHARPKNAKTGDYYNISPDGRVLG